MGGETKPGTPEASREKFKMRVLRALSRLAGKVGERPVGFGHAVGLLTHADGFAFVAGGIPELFGEPLGHGATLLRAGCLNDPAERQGLASSLGHRDGDLVVRTADPLGADFDVGLHIFQSLVEDADGIRGETFGAFFLQATVDHVKGAIEAAFGSGLASAEHDAVHEFRNDLVAVAWVGTKLIFTFGNTSSHWSPPGLLSKSFTAAYGDYWPQFVFEGK